MSKKRRPRFKDHNRFSFETPLPADLAMERLRALSADETSTLESHTSYRVSAERVGDSIYFEVKVMVSYRDSNWGRYLRTPPLLNRIINGQIREVDPTRTLVEGEMLIPAPVRAFGSIGMAILGAGSLLLYSTGYMPIEEFLLIVAVATFGLLVYIVLRNKPHPAIRRIEERIQPLDQDRNLLALRKEQHLDQLTDNAAYALSPKAAKGSADRQARG